LLTQREKHRHAATLTDAEAVAMDRQARCEFAYDDLKSKCRKIKRKAVEADFAAAMERALRLARSEEAEYLPGWCGPKADA
jgi:hypothetical protein